MALVSERVKNVKICPIRRLSPLATAARRRGLTIHALNIGQPDTPTPSSFMEGVRNAALQVLAYSPAQGMPETVEALLGYYADIGIELAAENIEVTAGGSEAYSFAIQATCDPGDEILIPEPLYPNYMAHAMVNGVNVVPIPTSMEGSFHLPPTAEIESLVTERTRAILYSNPSNPTGVAYSRLELERLVELANRHDLCVISDEPYRELIYDGEALSILSFPEIRDRAVLVDSISKRFSACGARLGCVATRNKDIVASVHKLCEMRLSPPALSEYGVIAMLKNPLYRTEIAKMVHQFRVRRDVMCSALEEVPGALFHKPEGAFYVFVRFPQIDDSEAFARFLLTDFEIDGETVFVAPGTGFYATEGRGRNEMRLAYVLEEGRLVRAMEVLAAGLEAYTTCRCQR